MVDPESPNWKPFSVMYESDGETYLTRVYALSYEHAHLVVQDLKETAQLVGEIVGEVK